MVAILPAILAALTLSQAQPAPSSQTIVVTGTRPDEYRAALAACLARQCPPNEDIDASAALAEALFTEGKYREARTVLRRSLGRNRDEARRHPEPLSELYRANSRVARHLGLDRDAWRSLWSVLRTLRTGIPQEDYRHFNARIEITEMLVANGRGLWALHELQRLAAIARAANQPDVAAFAEVRILWLEHIASRGHPDVRARLESYARSTDPRMRAYALPARLVLARIHTDNGDRARAEAMMQAVARDAHRRVLIYEPPYVMQVQETRTGIDGSMATGDRTSGQGPVPQSLTPADRGDTASTSQFVQTLQIPDNFEDKWIDVGFWVLADGSVADLRVVRESSEHGWAEPLMAAIRGRRYAAIASTAPEYRLERYSYTADYHSRSGSNIPQRSTRARVEYFDLTNSVRAPPRPPS